MSLESSSSQWLANSLSALLASPYVHFPQPPVVGGIPINLGPGPLDLFSTRFENLFTQDATGVVAGKQVDKDGLKEILLAVQQHWNPGNARFVDNPEQDGIEVNHLHGIRPLHLRFNRLACLDLGLVPPDMRQALPPRC